MCVKICAFFLIFSFLVWGGGEEEEEREREELETKKARGRQILLSVFISLSFLFSDIHIFHSFILV